MQEQAWQHNHGHGRCKTASVLGVSTRDDGQYGIARSGQDPRCEDDGGGDGRRSSRVTASGMLPGRSTGRFPVRSYG